MSEKALPDELRRKTRDDIQSSLFDDEPPYSDYWWGMPSFEQKDARPEYRVTVNLLTREDLQSFAERIGIPLTVKSDSVWYPKQQHLRGEFAYVGPKVKPRYPIYIPSKGRYDNQKTGSLLDSMGVDFHFVVEETEADLYSERFGADRVLVLPFHDLGQGSIPARNWIWEHAREHGFARHWCLDDNIGGFARLCHNRRFRMKTAAGLCAIEDFSDRYENIAFAGPHDRGFVKDMQPEITPVLWNSRIYSCILIDTNLDYRWRGRYNEDTDLSLRALKDGYCTALFRALLMDKAPTMTMKGGNTDHVYNTGDCRREFAESLKRQHPDVVDVVWKFNRWHHQVNYEPFKRNRPILKPGVTPTKAINEYGMRLVRLADISDEADA